MKIDFNISIANLVNIALGVALLVSVFYKKTGMTKEQADNLYQYYYSKALKIGEKQQRQINARLDTFNLIQKRIDARDSLYVRNDRSLQRLNNNLKRLEDEIKNSKNYYMLPVDSSDKFWSDRIGR